VAFPFLLAYNTYSPANPDPTTAWIDTWSSWATDEVRNAARNGASRLWDQTVRQQVTVVAPVVLDGTVTAGSDQSTFEVEVQRQLFPIGGGPETPTTPEVVRWRIVVTGTGTPTPLVANATALTGTTTVEDDSGVGG
jgi:hypothetical protein